MRILALNFRLSKGESQQSLRIRSTRISKHPGDVLESPLNRLKFFKPFRIECESGQIASFAVATLCDRMRNWLATANQFKKGIGTEKIGHRSRLHSVVEDSVWSECPLTVLKISMPATERIGGIYR